jgi:methyl-accepting chemotaxis protein
MSSKLTAQFMSLTSLELLVTSIWPAAVILIVADISTMQVIHDNPLLFIFVCFLCAGVVAGGELALVWHMQRAIKEQFADIITVCRHFMAGNKDARAVIQKDNELATLARTINALLDYVKLQALSPVELVKVSPRRDELQSGAQLQQFLREIAPVMDGDLRVKSTIFAGDLGVVADVCNYLIEELAQHIKWTRYSSDQVVTVTGDLIKRSIELAQSAEAHMLRIVETTEAVEKIVAFIQRLGDALQLSVDLVQGTQTHIQGKLSVDSAPHGIRKMEVSSPTGKLLEQLDTDTQHQAKMLENALNATQEHVALAESMIEGLYIFAQRIHESSTQVLNTAERVGSLITLAEQWRSSVASFQLAEEERHPQGQSGELAAPTPSMSFKRAELQHRHTRVLRN